MRISFSIGSLGFGGKERQLGYLIKNLPSTFKKQLIVFSGEIGYEEILEDVDTFHIVERRNKYSFRKLKDVYKQIIDFSPDIIHSWDVASPFLLRPLSLRYKTPIINGSLRTSGPYYKKLKNRVLTKSLVQFCDHSVSNSVACLNTLNIDQRNDVTCILNGFDIDRFSKSVNESLELDGKKIKICMVGRFFESKDHDLVIEAAKELNKRNYSVSFLMVGDGKRLKIIKEKCAVYGLNNVIFMGNRTDIPSILNKCDIGILLNPPGRAEGLSNSLMEYMATGLPIIATNSGGTPELINHDTTGYLTVPGNLEQLVHLLMKLIDDKELRLKIGSAAKAHLIEHFSMEKMIKSYVDLYTKIIDSY